jgi:hypothetical protein
MENNNKIRFFTAIVRFYRFERHAELQAPALLPTVAKTGAINRAAEKLHLAPQRCPDRSAFEERIGWRCSAAAGAGSN